MCILQNRFKGTAAVMNQNDNNNNNNREQKSVSIRLRPPSPSRRGTFTASSNLTMNIEKIAEILPVVPLDTELPVRKKRSPSQGRANNHQRNAPPQPTLPSGTIINVNYMGKIRGPTLKHKKPSKRWFRNSFSIVGFLRQIHQL